MTVEAMPGSDSVAGLTARPKPADSAGGRNESAADDARMLASTSGAAAGGFSSDADASSRDESAAPRQSFNVVEGADAKSSPANATATAGTTGETPVTASPFATALEGAVRPSVLSPVTPLQPLTPGQDVENVTRLVESMRVQVRQGVQEASVRLNPEHLGEVTISIRVERGAVSAVVHAETPAVQQWLESQEEKLRSGLADQGLNLERFVVHRDRQQERRDQRYQAPPQYRPRREDGPRFEVTV
jgi:flagellar hook-length control protein FliK